MEARRIPEAFGANGLRLTLVKRSAGVALYAVHLPDDPAVCGYEVHRIRVRPAGERVLHGRVIRFPLREVLAGNEACRKRLHQADVCRGGI